MRKFLRWTLGIDARIKEAVSIAESRIREEVRKELSEEMQNKSQEVEALRAEDYRFLAKRVSELEDEVFDCSADEEVEYDEDGEVVVKKEAK